MIAKSLQGLLMVVVPAILLAGCSTPNGTVTTTGSPSSPSGVLAVSDVAGSYQGFTNGPGSTALFNGVADVALDSAGNLYVADEANDAIREISPTYIVSTFAGTGSSGATNGTVASATFYFPQGVAVDSSGNVYVGDTFNNMSGDNKVR